MSSWQNTYSQDTRALAFAPPTGVLARAPWPHGCIPSAAMFWPSIELPKDSKLACPTSRSILVRMTSPPSSVLPPSTYHSYRGHRTREPHRFPPQHRPSARSSGSCGDHQTKRRFASRSCKVSTHWENPQHGQVQRTDAHFSHFLGFALPPISCGQEYACASISSFLRTATSCCANNRAKPISKRRPACKLLSSRHF